jgi:eukaryotic-like serine/threonine-protein kinase
MNSGRWERIQSVFHEVADRPAAEQRGFLEAACADDPTLIAEVLALLDEDARTSVLDRDVASVARDIVGLRRPRPRRPAPPTRSI